MLPAAGFVNGLAAPNAGGAIEVEESAAAGTRAMLDDEMAIEEDGFDIGQQRVVAVQISPASLHHANLAASLGIHEIRNRAAKKIGFGEEIGVEDGDKFALRGPQAVLQSASFVALSVGAMNVDDGHALGGVTLDAGASDLASLVGGVIEDLHVEQLRRVVEA